MLISVVLFPSEGNEIRNSLPQKWTYSKDVLISFEMMTRFQSTNSYNFKCEAGLAWESNDKRN